MKKILILVFVFLLPYINPVNAEIPGKLQGESFSDPSHKIQMPEDWQKKPVKYDPQFSDADIVITLDGQMFDAWEPLIQKYAKDHNLKIVTNYGTCGVSAGGLANKSIDIGAFCCPPGFADRLPGLRFHTAGIAAIALLVHPENPVNNITIEEARQIYQGNIHRWSELSGNKKPDILIQPVARLHCKLRPGHWRLLLDNKNLFSPGLFEIGAIPDMISQVAINPGAIGYEVSWMTRFHQDKGKVKILKINGYDPDKPSNLISAGYPLYRVYSFTTWEDENTKNADAKKIINYILQQTGHLDSKFGIIPASVLRKAGWKFRETELVGEPGK